MNSSPHFPAPLKPGDHLRVISPAGPVDQDSLARGVETIEAEGYRVSVGQHVLSREGYLAGSDSERCADLMEALTDPDVNGIICSRGGYGSGRIIDKLDWEKLRQIDCKAFVGFSDITALSFAMWKKLGWVSFSGLQAARGLGGNSSERARDQLWGLLDGSGAPGRWKGDKSLKLNVVRPGKCSGRLIPGCLSVMVTLLGTEFFPDLRGRILVIEDLNEHPYSIDRMLNHLRLSGVLEGLAGLILGHFINGSENIEREVGETAVRLYNNYNFPVWGGMPYGHVDDILTLPLGSLAELSESGDLEIQYGV